jgi:hypothetical protein
MNVHVRFAPPRRRRRIGCLSSLVIVLILGLGVMVGVAIIMGPWILTVGGRQRLLPAWEGVGDAQGPANGPNMNWARKTKAETAPASN